MSFRFLSNTLHVRLISERLLNQISTRTNRALCHTNQRYLFCANCVKTRASLLPRVLSNTPPANSTPSFTSQYTTAALTNTGFVNKIKKKLGFRGDLRYKKILLFRSGLRLYICCTDLIEHQQFFKEFGLPDTFASWFRITELHIWMAMCRLAAEKEEGLLVRNQMIIAFWKDVDRKSKKLGAEQSKRKQGVRILTDQFKGQCMTYDEGLMGDDKVLAGALWRGFYDQNCDDITQLELLVHYVRKQVRHLDEGDSGVLLSSGLITFIPLRGQYDDSEKSKVVHRQILKSV